MFATAAGLLVSAGGRVGASLEDVIALPPATAVVDVVDVAVEPADAAFVRALCGTPLSHGFGGDTIKVYTNVDDM